ncbi:hypothetical protein J7I98_33785 [Streptomyces sp. ISL-98]|uniref:hypothetical protein n=1 Tax=Streptomyces sp. ISL-98 TaxID=2819192 RepID=UPI001BE88470|nr:hypothetical protein [Streptomyces sp. ISL-98]MBT2510716.1 hypothetical protein [Streptomyces sp. ISL-98]
MWQSAQILNIGVGRRSAPPGTSAELVGAELAAAHLTGVLATELAAAEAVLGAVLTAVLGAEPTAAHLTGVLTAELAAAEAALGDAELIAVLALSLRGTSATEADTKNCSRSRERTESHEVS